MSVFSEAIAYLFEKPLENRCIYRKVWGTREMLKCTLDYNNNLDVFIPMLISEVKNYSEQWFVTCEDVEATDWILE